MAREDVRVIGLIGDICAGKSAVADLLAQEGAEVVCADQMVHELLTEPDVQAEVRRAFSDEVFDAHGAVDRRKLAGRVFEDGARLARLGKILYPRTRLRMQAVIDTAAASDGPGTVVLDAPTLLESGNRDVADEVLYVSAPRARRAEWAEARGWTEDEIDRRGRHLLPEAARQKAADHVIVNDGSIEELRAKVRAFWNEQH